MFFSAFFITNASLLFLHQLLYRAAELVGARCWLAIAADALEACNDVLVLHACDKAAYSLKVAVAATVELYICDYTILARYLNVSCAGAMGCIGYCFHGLG